MIFDGCGTKHRPTDPLNLRKRKRKIRYVSAILIGSALLSLSYRDSQASLGEQHREAVVSVQRFENGASHQIFDPIVLSVTAFVTSGSAWVVPAGFSTLVSVECIAGGGGGAAGTGTFPGRGGGGSAYAKITSTSTSLTPGVSINIGVGVGGAPLNDGTDTWWNATSLANAVVLGSAVSCAAQHGGSGAVAGLASASVGTTKFNGGAGSPAPAFGNGGGSGGSGGPNGAGGAASNTVGGTGDGGTVPVGNSGTEFDATHGCGAGQNGTAGVGANGRNYGGGASGGNFASYAGGTGAPGLIVIVYLPAKSALPFRQHTRFFTRRF